MQGIAMDFNKLVNEAKNLKAEERAELAKVMIESLDTDMDRNVEAAWAEIIQSRCDDINNGVVETQGWSQIKERVLAGKN